MCLISGEEMKQIDNYTIKVLEVPSIILMEAASIKFLEELDLKNNNHFTIICGVGNNGGDGLAIARHLITSGKNVDLFIIGNLKKLTKDAKINFNILSNFGIDFININTSVYKNYINNKSENSYFLNLKNSIKNSDVTIDAIFGVGLSRDIEGLYSYIIDIINNHSSNTISVDIPSGLDSTSGKVLNKSIIANKTVTFHMMKKGLVNNKKYTGEVSIKNIGIPDIATDYILNK